MAREKAQVIVVGGGPAGCTAAAVLAQEGIQVLLLERERFPRYHIGESLITETYWTFERIGVLDDLKRSDFPRKHSVQFFSASGKPSRPFYFSETNPHESSVTWQVDRAEFDSMLLENVRRSGGEVRQGVTVNEVAFSDGKATGVRGVGPGGEPLEIASDVVVDATGLRALTARQLGILRKDPHLTKASVYAHFENGRLDSGIDAGATLIINTPGNRGWFWYIPLSRNRVSVGVVGSTGELMKGRGTPEEILAAEIAGCGAVAERLEAATQVGPVRVTSDYTCRATRCGGDGYVLVGDSYGFIDPIYSSGVLLALKSGELAADTIVAGFQAGDLSGARLESYGAPIQSGMEAFRRMVYAFYSPGFSFASFATQHPEHREKLIQILIGDVFRGDMDGFFDDMQGMCRLPDSWHKAHR